MGKKRDPFGITNASFDGQSDMTIEEAAAVIEERFGPPQSDEESLTFNSTLIDGDIDPFDVQYQRPKSRG